MDDPEKTLLDMIKADWSITSGSIRKANIVFTTGYIDVEEALRTTPYVQGGHSRATIREEQIDFFYYVAVLSVYYWAEATEKKKVADAKSKKWNMVKEIKKIVQARRTSGSLPDDWSDVKVVGLINRDNRPQGIMIEDVLVRIRLFWSEA